MEVPSAGLLVAACSRGPLHLCRGQRARRMGGRRLIEARALTPTPPRSRTSPPCSPSRGRTRGCASMPLSPASAPALCTLGRYMNVALRLLPKYVLSPLAPFIKYWSTPKRAARMITTA